MFLLYNGNEPKVLDLAFIISKATYFCIKYKEKNKITNKSSQNANMTLKDTTET